ncbi:DUF2750 domain-containing protein [Acinetobacter defluvii]|uniref:DUF2750 domain-containing protein n=1 Tax=Acinetobacter defluvii TaxID=1871111 RepID=A0A2S2FHK2_9GAMM|nr:DUF2750 domain-containing protein [Acinetobacter defluvii]
MHQKQIENVFSLTSELRFQHFISKVCDWEELWILEDTNDHFLILTPEKNIEYLPVWPHSEYASQFSSLYPTYKPSRIMLNSFLKEWLLDLHNMNIQIGILPNLEISVWIIEPNKLKIELENELKQYE